MIRPEHLEGTPRNSILMLACAAILYLGAAAIISRILGFFPADPDYAYLMNGLNILSFKVPNYFDHPGTPVQVIIAVVLGISWLLTLPWHGLSGVQDQVLGHPQFYLQCVNGVFAAGIAGSLVFFAWSVGKASGYLAPALVGLCSLFSCFAVFTTFHHVMPEPVLLAATLVLAGLIAQTACAPDDAPQPPHLAAAIGISLAFCVTVKVTSAPVLLTVFFLRSWRARKLAILVCVASAFVLLLPILPRWPVMLRGYLYILTHKGDYGSGGAGAPSPSELLANLFSLWGAAPEMFVSAALYGAVLLGNPVLGRPLPANMKRALLLCLVIICAALLMVAKQPRPYYLVPVAAFVCLGNAILALLLLRYFPAWVRAAIVIVYAGFAFQFQHRVAQSYAQADAKSSAIIAALESRRGCFTIYSYGVPDPRFSLFFGSMFSGQRYADRLARLYPDFVAYKTDTKTIQTFNRTLSPDDAAKRLSREKCVDLMGGIRWQPQYGIAPDALKLVARSGAIYLYSLQPGWNRY